MAKQSDGTYYLSAFEITREQHRYLKLAAALNDCSIKELITAKVFDAGDMKAVNRRAQIIVDLHDSEADIDAETKAPETPEIPEESTACESEAEADIPTPPVRPKRSKTDRKNAYRREPKPPAASAKPTPVTDSLTDAERAHILEALAAEADASYETEDDGWARDEDPKPPKIHRSYEEIDDDDFIDDDDTEDEGDPTEIDFND